MQILSAGVRKRIFRGIGATGLGQVVTAVIQVVSVPLFLQFWGVELYGEWLILSAIPAYFAMSDMGFASVAANEMTLQVARGDRSGALEVFQSTWVFITCISFLVALVVVTSIWFIPIEHWLNLGQQSHLEVIGVVLFLTLHVLVGLQGGLLHAGFRCEGHYALITLFSNLLRFAEFGMVTAVVVLGATPLVASLIFLTTRAAGTFMIRFDLWRRSPWIVFGYRYARRTTLRRLVRPAIAFMAFPLGNIITLQGMVSVIGAILGPTHVVVFSTLRTLTRFAFQINNMITNTVWPELSMAYGAGNMDLARRLHCHSCQVSLWLSLSAVAGLSVFGGWIVHTWTLGKVVMDTTLFHLMLAVIVANSFWYTSSAVHLALNRHQRMALYYLTGTGLSLIIAMGLMPSLGLNGGALALLCVDLLMSTYVIRTSLSFLHDDFYRFLKIIVIPPINIWNLRYFRRSMID